MPEVEFPAFELPQPRAVTEALKNISSQTQALMEEFLQGYPSTDLKALDPLGLLPAYAEFCKSLLADPQKLLDAQFNAWKAYMEVWQVSAQRMMGVDAAPAAAPDSGDRRFQAEDWEANPFFDYVKQTYLVSANAMQSLVAGADGLDDRTAKKIEFYTRQFIDAVAPTNFALTNPEVLHATVQTGGKNLLDGLKNLLDDIDPKDGRLHTTMVEPGAFELGRNVAVTPGKVVFQNDLMQLIQYDPTTKEVFEKPLLIVPPWINKYYILDLQPKNSFIKWAVAQGHTVFVVSWVNPGAELAEKDFDDYLMEGPLAAFDAMQAATGAESFNTIGYCLGGTLMGAALAYLAAHGDERATSAAFFTSLFDFADPGDLGVFIDEAQLQSLEKMMAERGFLDGAEMATTFNMLRANDLIWSFVVNNYLLGKSPMAFDLLYWNADSTRMPARMHSTYLRKMYLENVFCEPGGMTINGTPIDLGEIKVPVFFVSALDDHIAPWKSTYAGARRLGGPVTFTVSKAGHIAGIVNPPEGRQYAHFDGPDPKAFGADEWLQQATPHDESWWPKWCAWTAAFAGGKVPARVPGDGGLKVIEDAPGSYVKQRIVEP